MADQSRIDDLRRRVQQDPASIAFAQLAEECRRSGELQEAVDVCRAGLAIHPGYLSARVTLGRALLELNQLDEARAELELVLKSASENLAAIRGLAEIHHRQGRLPEALTQYRAALLLARNDPDLQQTVDELTHQLEPEPVRQPEPPPRVVAPEPPPLVVAPEPPPVVVPEPPPLLVAPEPPPPSVVVPEPPPPDVFVLPEEPLPIEIVDEHEPAFDIDPIDPARTRALMTIDALEQFLDAIHDAGAERHA